MIELKIRLQPKQSHLWELWDGKEITRLGFGGARGGAKSGGGRRCMLLRRLQYPNTTGLILRRTYPELYKSHIVKLFEEFPITRSWWNEQRKELVCPNGSHLFFGSAEHEKDMANFYSAEFADVLVDEAQEFSQDELEKLTGSNRCTSNVNLVPKMVYTFMPGLSEAGIPPKGLNYLKRVFPDGILRGEETRQKWAFIQAFAWDNVEWARQELENDGLTEKDFYSWDADKRRDYFIARTVFGATLSSLTNVYLREAWLYGKWGAFEGQYFQNFRYEKDTIEASEIEIKPWHKLWISGDWGFDHPACFHWHREDENGKVVTYREFWSIGLGEAELGREIGRLSQGEKLAAFFLSWDAFGKLNKATRKPITQLIASELPGNVPAPRPADASPGTRISGWRLMHQLIDAGQWKISRECKKLIECLPTLVRDMQRNSEDVLKVDHSESYIGDDPADACFVAGTLVATGLGAMPIERIAVGDWILTRKGFRKVEKVGKREASRTLEIVFSNGTHLTGTPEHPVLVDGQWVRLDTLRYGDMIKVCELRRSRGVEKPARTTWRRFADFVAGFSFRTNSIKYDAVPVSVLKRSEEGAQLVYNLQVEEHPEYFANGVLVHNCRYGLAEMVQVVRKPVGVRVAERIAEIRQKEPQASDTHVMMALAEIQKQEERKAPRSVPIRRRHRF